MVMSKRKHSEICSSSSECSAQLSNTFANVTRWFYHSFQSCTNITIFHHRVDGVRKLTTSFHIFGDEARYCFFFPHARILSYFLEENAQVKKPKCVQHLHGNILFSLSTYSHLYDTQKKNVNIFKLR